MLDPQLAKDHIGTRLHILRRRCGLSIRQVSERSGVSVAMLSYVERGVNSISLVTLEKVLMALGTTLAEFFTDRESPGSGPVFAREQMRTVSDPDRTYTMLLSNRPGVQLEMLDEHIRPAKRKPAFSKLKSDVAGYVLSGSLILEVKGVGKKALRTGDAFYLVKGSLHRGYALEGQEVRLITAAYPASY